MTNNLKYFLTFVENIDLKYKQIKFKSILKLIKLFKSNLINLILWTQLWFIYNQGPTVADAFKG